MNIRYLSLPKKLILALALSLLMAVVLNVGGVSAQESNEGATNTQDGQARVETGFVPEEYEYRVEKSNNYTLLIRKSLQLYDQANDTIQLNEAQTIFAETNIAIDMDASDLIYVGDELTVKSELVAEYAQKSQELSRTDQTAWQAYADNANFELAGIEAENVDIDEEGQVVDRSQPSGNSDEGATENTPSDDGEAAAEDSGGNALWWILGGLGVAAIWYLLWQRGAYEE